MSEYQYIAFRAIDGPVGERNLAYMQRQSSRAEITPWSFDNEYNFGDFHGDTLEMMRRGYDIHLHYANFGIRRLFIRLPGGLPDRKAAVPYLDSESLAFVKDKEGLSGTLTIDPAYEPGDLEEIWDFDDWIDRLIPIRAELLAGDLRPLFIAQLTVLKDVNHDPDENIEAVIPFGLGEPTAAQRALAELYEIRASLIAAAAHDVPNAPPPLDPRATYRDWIAEQPQDKKDAWLVELMAEANSTARTKLLTAFRKSRPTPTWQTVSRSQSLAQLEAEAKQIEGAMAEKRAAVAAQSRARKLAKMAQDPKPFLKKSEELVEERSSQSYERIGSLLAELREALAETEKSGLAESQAWKLHEKHPTLRMLTSALRRHGFLSKKDARLG